MLASQQIESGFLECFVAASKFTDYVAHRTPTPSSPVKWLPTYLDPSV